MILALNSCVQYKECQALDVKAVFCHTHGSLAADLHTFVPVAGSELQLKVKKSVVCSAIQK